MNLISVAAFIKRQRTTAYARMSRRDLLAALNWFLRRGGLITGISQGRIVAVACVRPVRDKGEAERDWVWNPFGKKIFIELLLSNHPKGLPAMANEIAWRFPANRVLWRRCGRGRNRLREYSHGRTAQLVMKGTSYGPR